VRLFQTVPYSAYSTMTDMPLMDMVRYAEHMNLISRYTDPLGDVYTVDPTSAVIMTYFRNNILHLFALPSLIACFFKANDRFNGEQVIHLASLLYPYLRQELFIRYDNEEIPSIVNQWLDAFVEFGYVLKDSNGLYSVNDGNTESEMILGSLSHFVSQTLERFLIVAAILKRHDETGIDRETLEDQCHALGRRLSMLHGLNSPEYFDRTLFRSFIDTLINSEFLQEDEDHHLRSDRDMDIILNGASFVLSADVRKSIIHVIEKDHEKARHLHLNRTQSGRG
jgi:glycerol-3-phosphate O-acyltransferase